MNFKTSSLLGAFATGALLAVCLDVIHEKKETPAPIHYRAQESSVRELEDSPAAYDEFVKRLNSDLIFASFLNRQGTFTNDLILLEVGLRSRLGDLNEQMSKRLLDVAASTSMAVFTEILRANKRNKQIEIWIRSNVHFILHLPCSFLDDLRLSNSEYLNEILVHLLNFVETEGEYVCLSPEVALQFASMSSDLMLDIIKISDKIPKERASKFISEVTASSLSQSQKINLLSKAVRFPLEANTVTQLITSSPVVALGLSVLQLETMSDFVEQAIEAGEKNSTEQLHKLLDGIELPDRPMATQYLARVDLEQKSELQSALHQKLARNTGESALNSTGSIEEILATASTFNNTRIAADYVAGAFSAAANVDVILASAYLESIQDPAVRIAAIRSILPRISDDRAKAVWTEELNKLVTP